VGQRPTSDNPTLVVPDRVVRDEHVLTVRHGLGNQRGHYIDGIRLRIGQARYFSELGLIHRDGYSVYGGDGIHLYSGGGAPGNLSGWRNGDYRAGWSGWHQEQGVGCEVYDIQGYPSFTEMVTFKAFVTSFCCLYHHFYILLVKQSACLPSAGQ